MNYNPRNTLNYFDNTAQVKTWDFSSVPVPVFAINCQNYRNDEDSKANPDREALVFYALNHLSSVVRKNFTKHEPLPSLELEVMQEYQDCMENQSRRLLYYTALVTTRESRHTSEPDKEFTTKRLAKYGKAIVDFQKELRNKGSDGAANYFQDSPPQTEMGKYVDSMMYCFFEGSFSKGYGGKPWGMIAQTLHRFIIGEISMEMFIDTAYTLAHNNGPMFNKGMLYSMYSTIMKILDVQRSGQVPELILSDASMHKMAGKRVATLVRQMQEKYPSEFGEQVDWYKVEALGSLHKYGSEKAAQTLVSEYKDKMPVDNGVVMAEGLAAKAQPSLPTFGGKIDFDGGKAKVMGYMDVYPGQQAVIVERLK